jgi:hypothetical protein
VDSHLETTVELDGYLVILRLEVEKERLAGLEVDIDSTLADGLVQVIQAGLYTTDHQNRQAGLSNYFSSENKTNRL